METKWYIYTLDLQTGELSSALSCPDESTARWAFQLAGNNLEGTVHGGSPFFDYDYVGIVSHVTIDYKPYKKKGWFNKDEKVVYEKSKFDIDDFIIADLQTKKTILGIKGLRSSEIRADVMFMWHVDSELQKLANVIRLAEKTTSMESVESPVDYSHFPVQMQAATGVGVPEIIVAYQASIEDSDGSVPNVNLNNPKDISNPVVEAVDRLTEHLVKVFPFDESKLLTPKDYPDEKEGFWETEKDYAVRVKLAEKTLKRYRETNNGVRLSEDGTWGMDKNDNVFKKENDKSNSPYLYFVRDSNLQ
jgi:hypothetical protein